jgi:hypothetical protein
MPVLGIIASQISGHLFAPSGAYDSIATTTLGTATASVTFSSIPATYTHLQLRCFIQSDRATYGMDVLRMRINSDTGSNYAAHDLRGDGSSAGTGSSSSQTSITSAGSGIGTTTGSTFGAVIIDILDYANTNKYTTLRTLAGVDFNGTLAGFGGQVMLDSGLWMNTAAVTTIVFEPVYGTNFTQYSKFALYGVKGA